MHNTNDFDSKSPKRSFASNTPDRADSEKYSSRSLRPMDRKPILRSPTQNLSLSLQNYLNLAREAGLSGDRILAENYYQHAEHYRRRLCAEEQNKRLYAQQKRPLLTKEEDTPKVVL
jgi:hypothetical protein